MNLGGLGIIKSLSCTNVILASGSPRRSDILSNLGIEFKIQVSDFEENLCKGEFKTPKDYVLQTAKCKMNSVYGKNSGNNTMIIAADTIAVLESTILEKPTSESHALEMLTMLNGKCHSVLTALVVYYTDMHGILKKGEIVEETLVEFGNNSVDLLESYVKTLEPMDKAGAYGYQGLGSFLVQSIKGDYYNVVGFPAFAFLKMLIQIMEM
jgi:septum formation protein